MKSDLRFFPSDCFETFPHPDVSEDLNSLGRQLESMRASIMEERSVGLTGLYGLVNDPKISDHDIVVLRQCHATIDEAVLSSFEYGERYEVKIREFERSVSSEYLPSWKDIDLDHGFYNVRRGVRFMISPKARADVLDKLLALNHYRYRQEVEQGLHNLRGGRKRSSAVQSSEASGVIRAAMDAASPSGDGPDDGLFPPPGTLF